MSKLTCTKHTRFGPLLEVQMSKNARRCGTKHISKWKCTKHTILGPLLEVEMSKKCTPLWREAHFQVKMYKTPFSDHFWKLRCRKNARRCGAKHISKWKCTKHTSFGSWDVEKVHAVTARSSFRSENVQSTPFSDHFWKLRCRCGAKLISKWKFTKHTILGPLLEVEMSKKCTPLWREAHFQVKMYKAPHVRSTFGSSDVGKSARRCGAKLMSKWKCKKRTILGPLLEVQMLLRFASLHYTTLHYTILHSTTLHYITLHYTPLRSTTLHYTKLHYTKLHCTTLHSTTLHYTTLHYTTLHSTTLHYTTLHSQTLQLQLHSTDR